MVKTVNLISSAFQNLVQKLKRDDKAERKDSNPHFKTVMFTQWYWQSLILLTFTDSQLGRDTRKENFSQSV